MKPTKENIAEWFGGLQDRICLALEAADGGSRFKEDAWERPGGGGGRSRVFDKGAVIEKGGVNFSAVWGKTPEKILQSLQLAESEFYATGVSIVLHPNSPMVPIIHMNVRYFEMSNGPWWFGGGIDLTPHYIDAADARWFHEQLKQACDKHNSSYYPSFKKWADDYFYIPHRGETRGVGGIFFDRQTGDAPDAKEKLFAFVQDIGEAFAPIYTQLMQKNKALPFGEAEQHWQRLRRGRYVEFNLVWDRGTKFGLDTEGRTESILMSMPPQANWVYNYQPEKGSPEANTLALLKKDIDWFA
ncbi:oxygen-dependent coproporphyrinogen oxidase [Cesiribacter sp. SM1]|uniref:oxygen-dependent coproporphyrinogen oxidase n=1 Tax=Cesiribacter sp. SM1 TaxID=2861196 RepID=UPI001CD4D348|nr:oxygen-dependent coproporphyrinogen oxidase [Cesiribacter sp. SM1]